MSKLLSVSAVSSQMVGAGSRTLGGLPSSLAWDGLNAVVSNVESLWNGLEGCLPAMLWVEVSQVCGRFVPCPEDLLAQVSMSW